LHISVDENREKFNHIQSRLVCNDHQSKKTKRFHTVAAVIYKITIATEEKDVELIWTQLRKQLQR